MTKLETKHASAPWRNVYGGLLLALLTGEILSACSNSTPDVSDGAAGGTPAAGGTRAQTSGFGGATSAQSTASGGASTATTSGSSTGLGGSHPATGGVTSSATTSAAKGGASSAAGGTSGKSSQPGDGGTSNRGGTSAALTGGNLGTGGRAQGGTSAASNTGGLQAAGRTGSGASTSGGAAARGGTAGVGGTLSGIAGTVAKGGSGGSGDYRPCPSNGDVCKILPLGDSITYGMQSSDTGGYRVPLFKKVVAASQKITFTGSQKDGPPTVSGVTFPKNHEGHSGWTIDQIAGLVPDPAMKADIPHIVLLMAGTNDVYASSGQDKMQDRLSTLIDKVTAAAPNALLVVATLTPLSNASWNTTANTYDAKIPGVVQTKASNGKHVVMVDMSKMPTSQLSDGVHPNDAGYAYMADIWYAAIKDLLPQ